ncbi:MAG: CPBP family intramembrane metalloprotease [Chloroflexi bacterium]|nr:CPBP family intramembrane metalloprotease [Chloroflexota bacterium]MCC6893347.1 CPBP family intramembrane metalloprotease [Anaerolineae bacterium]
MFSQLMKCIASAEPQPPWSIWGAIGAMVASFVAVIFGTTVALLLPPAQNSVLLGWAIAAALVIALVWFTRRSPRYWPALKLGDVANGAGDTPFQNVFWYLLIGVGLAILLDIIGRGLVGQIVPDPELLNLYGYTQIYGESVQIGSWILIVLFMVFLQPIAEGLVFQGMLLPSLRSTISPWAGFILTAVAYTLFHFVAYQSVTNDDRFLLWGWVLSPFISATIYNAVRVYTGSTRAAILTHMAFGLFAVVKMLTLVSG